MLLIGRKHSALDCRIKDALCHLCKNRGYLAKVYQAMAKQDSPAPGRKPPRHGRIYDVQGKEQEEYAAKKLLHMGSRSPSP